MDLNKIIQHLTFLLWVAMNKPKIKDISKLTGLKSIEIMKWKKENLWEDNFDKTYQGINQMVEKAAYFKDTPMNYLVEFVNKVLKKFDEIKGNVEEMTLEELLKTTQTLSRAVQPFIKLTSVLSNGANYSKEDKELIKNLSQNKTIRELTQNLLIQISGLEKENNS